MTQHHQTRGLAARHWPKAWAVKNTHRSLLDFELFV
jgi:hypothetical protein